MYLFVWGGRMARRMVETRGGGGNGLLRGEGVVGGRVGGADRRGGSTKTWHDPLHTVLRTAHFRMTGGGFGVASSARRTTP